MRPKATDRVRNVWETDNKIVKPNNSEHLLEIIDQLSMPFAAGTFYYYIFNFIDYGFDFMSDSLYQVLGYESKQFNLDFFFEIMHPEDLEKMDKKERLSLDFKLNRIKREDISLYKTVYTFRLKHANGNYRTILHQARAVNLSKQGKVQQTLGVHADVTHLNVPIDHKISFISNERPSYYSLNIDDELRIMDNPCRDKISKREREIIQLLSKGMDAQEIAIQLYVSVHTVNTHKKNLIRKSGCKNINELISRCIREGVI